MSQCLSTDPQTHKNMKTNRHQGENSPKYWLRDGLLSK